MISASRSSPCRRSAVDLCTSCLPGSALQKASLHPVVEGAVAGLAELSVVEAAPVVVVVVQAEAALGEIVCSADCSCSAKRGTYSRGLQKGLSWRSVMGAGSWRSDPHPTLLRSHQHSLLAVVAAMCLLACDAAEVGMRTVQRKGCQE